MPTSSVLALKSIPVDADEASRKAILLELKALSLSLSLTLTLALTLTLTLTTDPNPSPNPSPNPNQGAARLHARGHRLLLRRLLPRGRAE